MAELRESPDSRSWRARRDPHRRATARTPVEAMRAATIASRLARMPRGPTLRPLAVASSTRPIPQSSLSARLHRDRRREAIRLPPELVAERDLVEQHEAVGARTLPQILRARPRLIVGIGRRRGCGSVPGRRRSVDDGDQTAEGADGDRRPTPELDTAANPRTAGVRCALRGSAGRRCRRPRARPPATAASGSRATSGSPAFTSSAPGLA